MAFRINVDKKTAIENLRHIADKLGHTPRRDEYNADPEKLCHSGTIIRRFGSWNTVLKCAGLVPRQAYILITDKQVIQSIQAVAKDLGHAPTGKEYDKHSKKIFHSKTIRDKFGSWNNALKIAGLPSHVACPYPHRTDETYLKALADACIKHPNEYSLERLIRYTGHTYETYTIHFGNKDEIKKALFARYGIVIKNKVDIRDQKDVYVKKIREFYDRYKRAPGLIEFEKFSGYRINSLARRKIKFNDLMIEAIGFGKKMRKDKYSAKTIKKSLLNKLYTAYINHPDKDKLTYSTFTRKEYIVPRHTLKHYFGSVRNAIKKANIPLKPRYARSVSAKQMLENLRAIAEILHHTPSISEYDQSPLKIVSSSAIKDRFSAWSKACIAAGLVPNTKHDTRNRKTNIRKENNNYAKLV